MSLLHEFSRHLAHSIPPTPPSQAEGKSRIESKSSRSKKGVREGEFVKGGNTWLLLYKEKEGVGESESRKSVRGVLQIMVLCLRFTHFVKHQAVEPEELSHVNVQAKCCV